MLKQSSLKHLRGAKNLLAFSAGGDSTALFFLLLSENISFDIAIVNYNIRKQSYDEVAYAQKIALKYNLKCHLFNAPQIDKNFESTAREIRYSFFTNLIQTHTYTNLLTAHHLGDRFEWMLMQFCKGAGCIELAGMQEIQKEKNHFLIRPLLHLDKSELLTFLHTNNLKYFEDETNQDEQIKRNHFRHQYSKPLLTQYLSGIKKSFQYIDEDKEVLSYTTEIFSFNDLSYFKSSHYKRGDIFLIDKYLKEKGHIITANERENLKNEDSCIVGRKYLITAMHNFIWITPYTITEIPMEKEFKEKCRILKIAPKMRPYLYSHKEIFLKIQSILNK